MLKEHNKSLLVLPPNKELDTVYEFSRNPTIYDQLTFLDFNSEGHCILGSSNIAGTFWEGTLTLYNSYEDVKQLKHSSYHIYLTASDGKFINVDTIALAEESGVLNILSTRNGTNLKPVNNYRHLGHISQIAVWNSSSNVLSCSGRGVSIWDVNRLDRTPLFSSEKIHLADINAVDTYKKDINLFVSASTDRKACLWDKRAGEASVLYGNEFSPLSSITINQIDSNYCVIGTLAGDVYLIDQREPRHFLAVYHCFNHIIGSLVFNVFSQIGVAGHTNEVVVLNTDNGSLREIYRDKRHVGIVKDLKWQENVLHSCGFGREIKQHIVS